MRNKPPIKLVIPDDTQRLAGTPVIKGDSGGKQALIIALADIVEAACVQVVQSTSKKKAA